jgi:Uma2 family endonuclease
MVTDEQFLKLVKANPDLRMERTMQGELIVMPPTGSEGGSHNAGLRHRLTDISRIEKSTIAIPDCMKYGLSVRVWHAMSGRRSRQPQLVFRSNGKRSRLNPPR